MAIAYIIPCSDAKRDTPQAARSLYVGAMFTHTLAAALALAADDDALVLIMSAKHGLVRLDDVLAPYNQRIDAKGAVDAATLQSQIEALGLDWQDDVHSMLPAKYFKVLDDALRPLDMFASNVYEGARGIGDQRHINASAWPEWQALRSSLVGTWNKTTDANVQRLRSYLDERRWGRMAVARVHNYLTGTAFRLGTIRTTAALAEFKAAVRDTYLVQKGEP